MKNKKHDNYMKEMAAQSKIPPITASLYDYSLRKIPITVHLVSCPRNLFGYELSVAGMA